MSGSQMSSIGGQRRSTRSRTGKGKRRGKKGRKKGGPLLDQLSERPDEDEEENDDSTLNAFKNKMMKLGITQQEKKKGARGELFADIGTHGYFEVLERTRDDKIRVNPDL